MDCRGVRDAVGRPVWPETVENGGVCVWLCDWEVFGASVTLVWICGFTMPVRASPDTGASRVNPTAVRDG